MRVWEGRTLIISTLLIVGVVALSGCGVVRDTVDGMAGQETTSQPLSPHSSDGAEVDDLVVTVTVESDADTTGELSVNIGSPETAKSLREDSVRLPFTQNFSVSKRVIFPLRNARVEVKADHAASYIECRISVDGQVVATHRAVGSAATATCDRSLQLGPS
ncbi:MAG: hypothetical protein Q4B08_13690 [Propionibacteriaceae bacterium]|nr:hypothetical protein [Propionibacteriaceae bacterium]